MGLFKPPPIKALCVKCQVVRTRRHCPRCNWVHCLRCKVLIHPRTLNVIQEKQD